MKPIVDLTDIPSGARFIDARFRHGSSARALFEAEHIPGAVYVDLEQDLAGQTTGQNGRHPLPERQALVQLFSRLGIDQHTPVIAYDDTDHAGAARLWALLQWMGHERVQVLNGGLTAWKRSGRPVQSGPAMVYPQKKFLDQPPRLKFYPQAELSGHLLVDARAPERFRGEVEPLDPVAGHIPGAKNLFYKTLMNAEGQFLPEAELRSLLNFSNPVFYCGSGVTGAVLLLAAQHVGLSASLYPGSWSEWCNTPGAPIAVGP